MEKISESILLQKCTPKTSKLDQVKTLNLSRMGLKSQDVPVSLLTQLRSLEQLDLSGNMLQEFPHGLSLPCLRVLNCSNNEMEDVTSLHGLANLEELRLEDNFYLTVNDEHKAMFLLPKLRIFNGKDISTTANHIRYVSSEILKKRVIGVWERSFSLPDPLTAQSLEAVERSFVSAACFQVKYGPSSLCDYTKWRVEMIAKEYLKSLTNTGEEEEVTEASVNIKQNGTTLSPAKRKSSDVAANRSLGSPQKKTRTNTDLPEASPRKSTRQTCQSTPQKVHNGSSSPRKSMRISSAPAVEESPRKSSRLQSTPQKNDHVASPRKVTQAPNTPKGTPVNADKYGKRLTAQSRKQTTTPTKPGGRPVQRMANTESTKVPQEPVRLKALHVLQCHSKQDSPEDFSTQLWACAFQPSLSNSDASGWAQTAATCGGETVCVIDCETGCVLKKYKIPGEEFFSLAWSSVMMIREGGGLRPCSILAAGGKRGMVKLLHPRANLAYGEFRASRRALSILRFSPRQGNFLFTGSYDNKVILWDIGGVDCDYNFKVSQLLVLETISTPLHLCLPPSSPDAHLLSACENGLLCFDIQLSKNMQKRTMEMEIMFPVYKKQDKTNNYRTIDGLSFLSDDLVASKSHMQGSIYLWSWTGTRALCQGKRKEVPAVILAELQWSSTDIPYLALSTCPGYGYVVCGDDKGSLWTYHVTDLMRANFKSGKAITATEVLDWPAPVRAGVGPVEGPSINSVAMDPELRYLVALSDKNMAVIWRREEL